MRTLGIIAIIVCCILIFLFAIIALNNGKRNPEVSLIPISYLIIQAGFTGYYLQKTSKGAISSEDVIVDKPEVIQIKMPRFYKISAVILTLVILFAMVSILSVALAVMNGYTNYGKRESLIIMTVLGLISIFIGIFNLLSAFRKYRIKATQEV